jgi:SHS2 domain-containing protein
MALRYEVMSHTADTGILVHGVSLREVFENAAFAMFDLMYGIGDLPGEDQVEVEVEAATIEELLVDWLSTLLFEAEAKDLALCSFKIESIGYGRAAGSATGVPLARVELSGPPIKAVTYHYLAIEKRPGGWSARVVFDV